MNQAKAFLKRYQYAVELIQQCEQDIFEIEATIDTINLDNDGMPRSSNISDRTASLAISLADNSRKREKLIAEAWTIREEVEAVIRAVTKLNPKHGRLLYMRYINAADWQDIADDPIIVHDSIYVRGALHVAALKNAETIINSMFKED